MAFENVPYCVLPFHSLQGYIFKKSAQTDKRGLMYKDFRYARNFGNGLACLSKIH